MRSRSPFAPQRQLGDLLILSLRFREIGCATMTILFVHFYLQDRPRGSRQMGGLALAQVTCAPRSGQAHTGKSERRLEAKERTYDREKKAFEGD